MVSVKHLVNNIETVSSKLLRRGFSLDKEKVVNLSKRNHELTLEIEKLNAERNRLSEEISNQYKQKDKDLAKIEEIKNDSSKIKDRLKEINVQKESVNEELHLYLLTIPNIPSDKAPDGLDESDATELYQWGEKPKFVSDKDHVEIGESLKILDISRAAKLSGSRFSILVGAGAVLERALTSFLLDEHRKAGYTEISVPYLVNAKTMTGTGQLPKFEEDLFKVIRDKEHDLYLIPTAEVPVTNYFAEEIISTKELPLKFSCQTSCFRAEAGSYGRDTRGIIRQHQFSKVELVHFCTLEEGWKELEKLKSQAEGMLRKLNLHYRAINLPAGDISFAAKFCYDLEAWIPSQNMFREVSSCSLFDQFQSRRANIRHQPERGEKTDLVCTVNGSALPIGRILVAIFEQYYQPDGSLKVPECLVKYTHFSKILPGGVTL